MQAKIKYALMVSGYEGQPNILALINCYLDRMSAEGEDIETHREDIRERRISIDDMCNKLMKTRTF